MSTVLRTYKFRLQPTKTQKNAFNHILEGCRFIYNNALETRKTAWEEHKRNLSVNDTINRLPQLVQEHAFLGPIHSQVRQNVCRRLDNTFKAFFRRVQAGETPGYPRFKGRHRYHSFTYPQSGFVLRDKHLQLSNGQGQPKMQVPIRLHRSIPEDARIKTLTIKRSTTGKFYACFAIEVPKTSCSPAPLSDKAVGVDVGLTHYATFSDGTKINNPRFYRTLEQRLAKAQRKLSGLEKGTRERSHQRLIVARLHERIRDLRSDFAHQLSHRLVKEYQTIAVEDLNVKGMMESGKPWVKGIADASWSTLLAQLEYKAESAGRAFVRVDPRGTSQRCHRCQTIVPKDLSVRIHHCPHCQLTIDRDENSAKEILRLGLESLKAQRSDGFSRSPHLQVGE